MHAYDKCGRRTPGCQVPGPRVLPGLKFFTTQNGVAAGSFSRSGFYLFMPKASRSQNRQVKFCGRQNSEWLLDSAVRASSKIRSPPVLFIGFTLFNNDGLFYFPIFKHATPNENESARPGIVRTHRKIVPCANYAHFLLVVCFNYKQTITHFEFFMYQKPSMYFFGPHTLADKTNRHLLASAFDGLGTYPGVLANLFCL